MNKDEKITVISLIILAGFLVSLAYHYILGGVPFNLSWPYNTFLFNPSLRFSDLTTHLQSINELNIYQDSHFPVYPPLVFLLTYPYTFFPSPISVALYLITFVVFHVYYVSINISINGWINYKDMLIISFLTYPFLFEIDRANPEFITYILLCLFFLYYQSGQFIKCSIVLSLAIATKLYPSIFILLFLSDKKIKEIFYVTVMSIVIIILSAVPFEGSINDLFSALSINFEKYKIHYVIDERGLTHNTSLWGAIKVLYEGFLSIVFDNPLRGRQYIQYIVRPYLVIIVIATAIVAYIITKKEDVIWKKTALLVFAINLFPYVSSGYKMLLVYLPLFFFINNKPSKNDKFYSVMFSLLLIPKHYIPLGWAGTLGDGVPYVWSEVLIDPLLMVIFAVKIIHHSTNSSMRKVNHISIKTNTSD